MTPRKKADELGNSPPFPTLAAQADDLGADWSP